LEDTGATPEDFVAVFVYGLRAPDGRSDAPATEVLVLCFVSDGKRLLAKIGVALTSVIERADREALTKSRKVADMG